MTTAQVVKTSVTVNNNSPIQDYIHPDDQTQPSFVLITNLFADSLFLLLPSPPPQELSDTKAIGEGFWKALFYSASLVVVMTVILLNYDQIFLH